MMIIIAENDFSYYSYPDQNDDSEFRSRACLSCGSDDVTAAVGRIVPAIFV
jgi:hypothetical protein